MTRVVVTGATSGIGAATVRSYREAGHDVLAVARRKDRLAALAEETGAQVFAADVRDDTLSEKVADFEPSILVNNAGVGHGIDGLVGAAPHIIQEAIDINVSSLVKLTAATLPGMIKRRTGHIVNIGSIAGLHTAVSSLYGASKAAVHIFSQNLRNELVGTGLRVTEVCPGRVASGFYDAAKGDRERLDAMNTTGIRELDPKDIAAAILFATDAPAHVNVATLEILPTDQAIGGVKMKASDGTT